MWILIILCTYLIIVTTIKHNCRDFDGCYCDQTCTQYYHPISCIGWYLFTKLQFFSWIQWYVGWYDYNCAIPRKTGFKNLQKVKVSSVPRSFSAKLFMDLIQYPYLLYPLFQRFLHVSVTMLRSCLHSFNSSKKTVVAHEQYIQKLLPKTTAILSDHSKFTKSKCNSITQPIIEFVCG